MLQHIKDVLPNVKWKKLPDFPGEAYQGQFESNIFLVVSFSIEDQGFPPGSKGYDGTVISYGTIIHLTRELAQEAFEYAVKYEKDIV